MNRQQRLAGRVGDQDVRFELEEGQHVLGRATDCDVVLAESSVSRRHAETRVRERARPRPRPGQPQRHAGQRRGRSRAGATWGRATS